MQPTLVLFDIDGTLVHTSSAGIRAVGLAGRELYGPDFDERRVDYAGRLDVVIFPELLRAHGHPPSEADRLRAAYRKHLDAVLQDTPDARANPGMKELVLRLHDLEPATVGLLTGNYPETGTAKLVACGLDMDHFAIRVWSTDGPPPAPDRADLPPIGMIRWAEQLGKAHAPERTVVIGDTPEDIRCAKENGCRSIGVATGHHTLDDLQQAGADLAVPDLSDTESALDWIMS